jgi:hypothetical protein
MSAEEEALIDAGNHQLEVAARAFNIEDLPPALVSRDFLRGKAIQLQGILNRLELPAAEEIPDAADMAGRDLLVCFNELGPHSKDILVYFFLRVPDYAAELAERERILFRIVSLAEDLGIAFAFPTQTLHMATADRCG